MLGSDGGRSSRNLRHDAGAYAVLAASLGLAADAFEVPRSDTRRTLADHMAEAGCDVAALSCTELPLIVTPEASPLPMVDSTRLLARTAVAVACGDAAIPAWRGGPVA